MTGGALFRMASGASPGYAGGLKARASTAAAGRWQQAPPERGWRGLTLANLVEGAAVGEVRFLRFRPAAELLIDGEQLQFREFISIFLRHVRIARTVEVLRRNLRPSGE